MWSCLHWKDSRRSTKELCWPSTNSVNKVRSWEVLGRWHVERRLTARNIFGTSWPVLGQMYLIMYASVIHFTIGKLLSLYKITVNVHVLILHRYQNWRKYIFRFHKSASNSSVWDITIINTCQLGSKPIFGILGSIPQNEIMAIFMAVWFIVQETVSVYTDSVYGNVVVHIILILSLTKIDLKQMQS
jgi:hypothetical protein